MKRADIPFLEFVIDILVYFSYNFYIKMVIITQKNRPRPSPNKPKIIRLLSYYLANFLLILINIEKGG